MELGFISSAVILLIAATVMNILFKNLGLGSITALLVTGIIDEAISLPMWKGFEALPNSGLFSCFL